MPHDILQNLISHFSIEEAELFFRKKSDQFNPSAPSEYAHLETERFFNAQKLGEIAFAETGDKLIVFAAEARDPLTERSGKKAQYEIGKTILKTESADAGIFIFYDGKGAFRFSLIYPQPIGKKRIWSNFRRFTYFVSAELANKTFLHQIGGADFGAFEKIKEAFSVEKVTKEFYKEIANWYFWAVENCKFPKDAEDQENGRKMAVIRLITRLVFIWFMRERGLISRTLFDKDAVAKIIKDVAPNNSTYYKAILQNLFFATLSTKKEDRKFGSEVRGQKGKNPDFGNQYVYRYHEFFNKPENIKAYFGEIPFLNGGLFECLDEGTKGIYIDGFTRRKEFQPAMPNYLFFSQDKRVDLNIAYGTQNRKYQVRGLIDILYSYNFTIDENDPNDAEIALDPELLGKVFENLLANFNPETGATARKATGSYYTPREIVDYMVTQSLKEYLKTHLPIIPPLRRGDQGGFIKNLNKKLNILFESHKTENPFGEDDTKIIVKLIDNLKIVDPAVGSGAFPMGILNKLVFLLSKLDPDNQLWKETQLTVALNIPDAKSKNDAIASIEKNFSGENVNYGRKLYLIQKCIYGVDLQPIAVEIAKLRFFISLLVDVDIDKTKPDWNIEPLPNLDFKIMQGNSLIEDFEGVRLFDDKFLAVDLNNRERRIQILKTKQLQLQKVFISWHNAGKLTLIRKNELEPELNRITEHLAALHKPEKKGHTDKAGLFDIFSQAKQKIEEFKKLQKEFYSEADHKKKADLKTSINKLEWELIEATLKEQGTDAALEKLQKYKNSNSKPFFLWKLNFAEVFQGDNPGFDIVIANPPYVRQEAIKSQKKELENHGYEVYVSTADLYTYFYEKSYQILKPCGVSAFISSNKWLRANYGTKLREFLNSKTTLLELIDFNGHKVFEATVDTNIMIFTKQSSPDDYMVSFVNIESDFVGKDIAQYAKTHLERIPKNELKSNGWSLINQKTLAIKKKIEDAGTPLKDWDVKICRGIVTGFNEAFIINTARKEKLCKRDPNSEKILKPILRGRDIGRYFYNWQGLYLIKIESGWTDKNRGSEKAEDFFAKEFPAVYEYLKDIGKKCEKGLITFKGKGLFNRDDQGRYWWELRDCDYYGEFEMEKIVYPEFVSVSSFAFDGTGKMVSDTAWFLNGKSLLYLLAILNSKIVWFYLLNSVANLSQKAFRMKKIYLDFLPIPQISKQHQTPFITLVNKILALTANPDYLQNPAKQSQVRDYQRQIDELVYELYGLSGEERRVVEGG